MAIRQAEDQPKLSSIFLRFSPRKKLSNGSSTAELLISRIKSVPAI